MVKQSKFSFLDDDGSITPEPTPATVEPTRKPGKRGGKSSDPNFKKVTVYLSKPLDKRARQYILDHETEYSLLVEQAVSEFLDKHS